MFAQLILISMKKYLALFIACSIGSCCFAQQENESDYGELKGGFKQENIFIGGGASINGGYGQFSLGVSPEIGYSFTQWLDAGIGLNVIYSSIAANTIYNPTSTKQRQWNYGGGPFVRAYPFNFLFVQGQFEENWTRVTLRDGNISYKQTVNAPSLIAGIGYTQREVGAGSYYMLVGLDLLKNRYSPYVGENNAGQLVAVPIIRAGFNFYLKPSIQAAREPRYQSARIL